MGLKKPSSYDEQINKLKRSIVYISLMRHYGISLENILRRLKYIIEHRLRMVFQE